MLSAMAKGFGVESEPGWDDGHVDAVEHVSVTNGIS